MNAAVDAHRVLQSVARPVPLERAFLPLYNQFSHGC